MVTFPTEGGHEHLARSLPPLELVEQVRAGGVEEPLQGAVRGGAAAVRGRYRGQARADGRGGRAKGLAQSLLRETSS